MTNLQQLLMGAYPQGRDLQSIMNQRVDNKQMGNYENESLEQLIARFSGQQAPGMMSRATDSQMQDVGGNGMFNLWGLSR